MCEAAPIDTPKKFKLIYFNAKALAEPIRFLLSYGGIDFEDVRFSVEEWPALKPLMPMGQTPVLEVDGKRVHQSIAMTRYVARIVGLAGANAWEGLLIDIVVDTINDFRQKCATVSYEPEEEIKNKKMITLTNETIPFYFEKLEAMAKENNGFFAFNGKLSWAEFYFVGILDYLNYMTKTDLTANYPNIKAVVDNVYALEAVKAWVAKRPFTEH